MGRAPLARSAIVAALAACSPSRPTTTVGPVFDATALPDVATDHVPEAGSAIDVSTSARPNDAATPDVTVRDAGAGDVTGDSATSPDDARADVADSRAEADTAPAACPSGAGTLVLVGGSSSGAFGAISTNGAPFDVTSFAGDTVAATPAIVGLGGGAFLSVFPRSGDDVIESTRYADASWSTPSPIAAVAGKDAAATEQAAPSLALVGGDAELVYAGSNFFFYHGVYSGGAWGAASDAVGGTVSQDYGPSQPTAAAAGSTLSVAWDGSNHGLYVDAWTVTGGWVGAQPITGAGVDEVPPTMVALDGGDADLLLVYVQQTTTFLYSVVHTASGWSAPVAVGSTAIATLPVSLAPLAPPESGGVVMVYEGTDGLPYASIYSPTSTPAWATPVSILPGATPLRSPPAVATGVCGADAIAAVTQAAGITIVASKGGAWSPLRMVPAAGATYATLATGE
jgi:hypothetical protein